MSKYVVNILSSHECPPGKPFFLSAADSLGITVNYYCIGSPLDNNINNEILWFRASGNNDIKKIQEAIDLFEMIPTDKKVDSSYGLRLCSNKIPQTKHALENKILMPKTSISLVKDLSSKNYPFPFVLKSGCDYGGKGVFLIRNETDLDNAAKKFQGEDEVVIQEFIETNPTTDLRVYVIGNKCTRGIKRTAKKGEFRCNTKQGSTFISIIPDDKLSKLAINIAKSFKMELVAIDFIENDGQYYFLEINDSFGLNKNVDLAREILTYLVAKYY